MINFNHANQPRIPSTPFQPDVRTGTIAKAIPYLKAEICPFCHTRLKMDVQSESIFAFCDGCHEFDLSVHLDIETKQILLAYSSISGANGYVDPMVLKSLESVLVRKELLKFR
ncbi:MAG: hypothetical protein ACFFCS_01465 [Candidatus Hodarchaeota archaeon]